MENGINQKRNQNIVYSNNEIRIKNTYCMLTKSKIGSGSFGEIYNGYNIHTKEKLAFKLELNTTKSPQLAQEYKVLKSLSGYTGFTQVYYFSSLGEDKIMIMELLGQNLEELIKKMNPRRFSLKSVLMIADQMLVRLNTLHDKDYIHRDLKPENCVIGLNKKENIIYLIDFGLSRRFRDGRTGEHIPYKEGKNILGTIRYVSIYTHYGIEQSRRDDIESLGYILVYLAKGILPWQGIKAKTQKEKYNVIKNSKLENKPEILCYGLPDEFRQYFEYIRGVEFTERPDYNLLRGLFNKSMVKMDYVNDSVFDWCKLNQPIDIYQNHVPIYDMSEILKKLESLKKNKGDKEFNTKKKESLTSDKQNK